MSAHRELDDRTHQHILQLSRSGDECIEQVNYAQAIDKFRTAFELIPEPYQDWDASLWLLTSLGEAYYFDGEYGQAHAALTKAMHVPGAIGNPLIGVLSGDGKYSTLSAQNLPPMPGKGMVKRGFSCTLGPATRTRLKPPASSQKAYN